MAAHRTSPHASRLLAPLLVLALLSAAAFSHPLSVSAQSSGSPITVTVTHQRGNGATYYVGETFTVCVAFSRPALLRLSNFVNGDRVSVKDLGFTDRRRCFDITIEPPLGDEVLRFEAIEDGRVVGAGEARYQSRDRQAGQPSGSNPQSGGSGSGSQGGGTAGSLVVTPTSGAVGTSVTAYVTGPTGACVATVSGRWALLWDSSPLVVADHANLPARAQG